MGEQNQLQVNTLLLQTDEYVRYEYLSVLDYAVPRVLDRRALQIIPGKNVRLMHLDSFTFDSSEDLNQKIWSVYGAIEKAGITAALILDGRKDYADLYLGVFTEKTEQTSSGYKAFLSSFDGVFPGCKYKNIKFYEGEELINDLMNPDEKISIAAVSGFPINTKHNMRMPLAGLDTLVDGMRDRPFTMILLAEAINRAELVQMRQGFESLYTQISPLQQQNVSVSSSYNESFGSNFSKSITDSLSISSGISKGHTETSGSSHTEQTGINPAKKERTAQMIGTAAGVASLLTIGPEGLALRAGANIIQSLYYGQNIAHMLNNPTNTNRKAESDTTHQDFSDSMTEQKSVNKARSYLESRGFSVTSGASHGQSMQLTYTNKSVSGLLDRIDKQIQELMRLESEGAYKFAAYFIAGDEETASSAASMYRSIVTAGSSAVINSPVFHWKEEEKVKTILDCLRRGMHPSFEFEGYSAFPFISTAQPIGLSDFPYYLCLPQKSVFGIDVSKHAAFSRDIIHRDKIENSTDKELPIGCIYHMGKEIRTSPVNLNIDTLTSHLFVAGATGVGKSNFCYQVLDELINRDIKTLIIEPAKGEYAKVFGGRDDFSVYGTNLKQAPPLRINPFAFPKGITAAEHIERLLAIFSAAWPMYSAMPAIMKEALNEIYRQHGFDDVWGELPEGGIFPTFEDLLRTLPQIIKTSQYSAEVQGNYTGALVTRVKSMTNGIYNIIFSADEIGDEYLYDENVIIDLSRIGSEETKSLIMGFLVTRLVEYRSCSGRMNSKLMHVTLLEEAHHLLGKQNGGQSQDFGNMKGASVEMLNNAIREMRTYGEGFMIADQSPTVMDPTVISNTQTKVFFMMPRKEDRRIAGDAASLTEAQCDEIAKLPRGVAVVWQNEWSAAVLSKINYFASSKHKPFVYKVDLQKQTKKIISCAVAMLIQGRMKREAQKTELPSTTNLTWLNSLHMYGLGKSKQAVEKIFSDYIHSPKPVKYQSDYILNALEQILDIGTIVRSNKYRKDIVSWEKGIMDSIAVKASITKDEIQCIITTYLYGKSNQDKRYKNFYVSYLTYCKNKK